MNTTDRQSRTPGAILWILILGGSGFAAGFFGPLIFVPEANQGPLLGIFISGPGGALLGLLLYLICRLARLSDPRKWQVLWSAAAILVVVTLYFCLPEPALRGYVIDAQVQACRPPSEKVDAAIEYWQKRVAATTWATPREGWQAEARQESQSDDGAVVDVLVTRKNRIYEQRKPWNKGTMAAKGWETVNEQKSYYVKFPDSCADYVSGAKAIRYTPYDLSGLKNPSQDWPPRKVADFLNVEVLRPVPETYRALVTQ